MFFGQRYLFVSGFRSGIEWIFVKSVRGSSVLEKPDWEYQGKNLMKVQLKLGKFRKLLNH